MFLISNAWLIKIFGSFHHKLGQHWFAIFISELPIGWEEAFSVSVAFQHFLTTYCLFQFSFIWLFLVSDHPCLQVSVGLQVSFPMDLALMNIPSSQIHVKYNCLTLIYESKIVQSNSRKKWFRVGLHTSFQIHIFARFFCQIRNKYYDAGKEQHSESKIKKS